MKLIYLESAYYDETPKIKAENVDELDYNNLTYLLLEVHNNVLFHSKCFKKTEKTALIDQLVKIAGGLGQTLLDSKEVKFLQNYKASSAAIEIPVGYGGSLSVKNGQLTVRDLDEIYSYYSSPEKVRCNLSVELPSFLKKQIKEYYAKRDGEKQQKAEKKKQKKIEAAKKLLEKSGVKIQ